MTTERLMHIIRMNLRRSSSGRANYLKKNHLFASIGDQVKYQPRMIPLYPELIKLHSNIMVGAGVRFVTHDAVHTVLNRMNIGTFPEQIGCIEVMDNVFIGADTTIMPNVRIGSNVIIGANSLVTKDCEDNSVYAGIPARRIGSFDDYVAKRQKGGYPTGSRNQRLTQAQQQFAWEYFQQSRDN